jgi:hypothetical protein
VTEVRSFRRVFDLERRIYRVDRLRLNPGGVPVRGVLYFLALLGCALLLGRVPLVAGFVEMVPWYLRDGLLPGAAAALLAVVRIEGRPFDLAALALVRRALRPRRLIAGGIRAPAGVLWHPPDLLFLPDGSDARLRRLRFTGPGAARITVAHELGQGGGVVTLGGRRTVLGVGECERVREAGADRIVVLARGTSLVVCGGRRAGR